MDAFEMSRRNLFLLQARLKEAGGDPRALVPKSKAPHRRRTPSTPQVIVEEIRRLRTETPNLGKARIHVVLKRFCADRALPCPSESTIGRIIARAPDKMRTTPLRRAPRGHRRPARPKTTS